MKPFTYRFTAEPLDCDDLRIIGASLHEPMPAGLLHRPHGLGSYLLAIFHTDAAVYQHGVSHSCPPQSLILWEPDTFQHFGNPSAAWEYSWVTCDGPLLQQTSTALALPCNELLLLPDTTGIEQFLQRLHWELTQYFHPNPHVIRNHVQNLFLEIQRQRTTSDAAQKLPPWAIASMQYMKAHFAESLTLDELAKQVHCSQRHFGRQFHEVFGVAPMEYLTQLRMHVAKELLVDDNLSIADIAIRTGYGNLSYFAATFRRCYHVSPREMREGLTGETGRRQRVEERRNRQLEHWLREGWQLEFDADFAQSAQLDPRLRAFWSGDDYGGGAQLTVAHMADITDGLLRLHPNRLWTGITWDGELSEEVKVDLVAVNTHPDGLNLAITISGDLRNGYRLRLINYDNIVLETAMYGGWEILQRCRCILDAHAPEYHIVFWRSENVFYAEIDGRRILDYPEPFAPRGAMHRRCVVARYHDYGSADLRLLRVYTRITPSYVDILEPGRTLLRAGLREEAAAWFQRVAQDHPERKFQQEASYLTALAVPDEASETKETAFQQATVDLASPFHPRLLRQWALFRLERGDIDGAVALACAAADDDTAPLLAEKIVTRLSRLTSAEAEHALTLLARLPLRSLNLRDYSPRSLHPFHGMSLRELLCPSSRIADLSPLRGMPLEYLEINNAAISDLTPLAQMPLRALDCANNRLRELTPLLGILLQSLHCHENAITDLSPLAGMPLAILNCDDNRIRDLSPLRGMPLHTLYCSYNTVQSLAPLRGMPLRILMCSGNAVQSLAPLRGMPLCNLMCSGNAVQSLAPLCGLPLSHLDVSRNVIRDLSPLSGLPVRYLNCGDNPLASLRPLRGMAIEYLAIDDIPLTEENMQTVRELPLRHLACDWSEQAFSLLETLPTLEGMNYHTLTHVRHMREIIREALAAWRHAATGERRPSLLPYATPCGDMRYLALPMRVSRTDAEVFSRYYGGRLAAPASEEQFRALHAYLAPLVYRADVTIPSYHLDVAFANATRHGVSHAGTPYQWRQWGFVDGGCPPLTTETPYFLMQPTVEQSTWRWESRHHTEHFVVLEWEGPEERRTEHIFIQPELAICESCGLPNPQCIMPVLPSPGALPVAPSEHAQTAHDTAQDSGALARLLSICTGEQGQRELMAQLGLHHRQHFMIAYLQPALVAGFLERTIPDKPRSGRQRYRLTAKGQDWVNANG